MPRRRRRSISRTFTSRRSEARRRARLLWTLFYFAVAAAVVAGLAYTRLHSTLSSSHPAYVVLGDVSTDMKIPSPQASHHILMQLSTYAALHQGFVAVTPFQDHAQANANWKSQPFIPSSPHDTTAAREEIDADLNAFRHATANIFSRRTNTIGTDILGALLAASDEFQTFPQATSKTIVLISNMANYYPRRHGISLRQPLSTATIERDIQQLAAMHPSQIARLRGDCVYIIGAGLFPNDESITRDVEGTIHEFWTEYFARAQTQPPHWISSMPTSLDCP